MKHLDLFSGIGGFALAAEMVWGPMEHVFCDNEPFAQAVLLKHWPQATIFHDIRTLTANAYIERFVHGESQEQPTVGDDKALGESVTSTRSPALPEIDILTGGFPCQPFSNAGRRLGTEDDRHLWPDMLRVIREFHPRWVVAENVSGLITWSDGLVLEQVHTDLENEGYEVQSFIIPAVSLNAPHGDRVWIVAHRRQQYGEQGSIKDNGKDATERSSETEESERRSGTSSSKSDSGRIRRHERASAEEGAITRSGLSWNEDWHEVASRLCRVDDGIPTRLDRNPRLKALGNAIVPQVAAQIFQAIKHVEENI